MRLAVVGKRDWKKYWLIWDALDSFLTRMQSENQSLTIITGDAEGADKCARLWAEAHRLEQVKLTVHAANWNKFRKAAGPYRNTAIVNDADAMLAAWDYYSTGTKDSVSKAVSKAIPLWVLEPSGAIRTYTPPEPLDSVIAAAISKKR